MYLSAKYIDVKKHQDSADFSNNRVSNRLILCDGIGQFEGSGQVANLVVNEFIKEEYTEISELLHNQKIRGHKNSAILGGTTIITASVKQNKVSIEYLGNGGVIHLPGNFGENPNSDHPYRYSELMLPHVHSDSSLTKHLSHHSQKQEWSATKITLSLNHTFGDILLFFTDGITSLEDKIILKDGEGRYWRNEAASIQCILQALDEFLNQKLSNFQEALIKFNDDILKRLKSEGYLEDDASLGIIITPRVLEHYNTLKE